MAHDFQYGIDPASPRGSFTAIRIFHDQLIERFSEEVMWEMLRQEITKALQSDEDLRILLREMVRDSISKMNLGELVAHAVKQQLAKELPAARSEKPE